MWFSNENSVFSLSIFLPQKWKYALKAGSEFLAFCFIWTRTGKLSTAGCFFKKQPLLLEFIISAFCVVKFYSFFKIMFGHVQFVAFSVPKKCAWPWKDQTENWIFPLIQFRTIIPSFGAVFRKFVNRSSSWAEPPAKERKAASLCNTRKMRIRCKAGAKATAGRRTTNYSPQSRHLAK